MDELRRRAVATLLVQVRHDFLEAGLAFRQYAEQVDSHNSPLRIPLVTAGVVAYGRAFKFDRSERAKQYARLNDVFGAWPPLSGPWLTLHTRTVELRDELFAHSDRSRRQPKVFLAGDDYDDDSGRVHDLPRAETRGWWMWSSAEIPALHHLAASMDQLMLHALRKLLGSGPSITEVTNLSDNYLTTGQPMIVAAEGSPFTDDLRTRYPDLPAPPTAIEFDDQRRVNQSARSSE